ncbi:MAG: transglutaminase family protein [Methanimicrococcus sp.]|nr:transglutaminase family protein [Methanimicrococcus sp.]
MDFSKFLAEHPYVDFSSPLIQAKADELFRGITNDVEKTKIAYEYVRDEIPHSFDIPFFDIIVKTITAKASDVLKHGTGICHAKSNLLAALLRSQSIPAGFCFQHLTLMDDDSSGYCVHCFNAVFVNGRWIKIDARGNTNGKNAQFSLNEPILAFPIRKEYDEYFWDGIYASPHMDSMKMLEKAKTLQDILNNIPDYVHEAPDVTE